MQNHSPPDNGLTTEEAQQRLQQYGYNDLPMENLHSLVRLVVDIFREPMIMLLVIAGILYLLLGNRQEAFMLVASIGIVVGIEFYQERRTERAVAALRDLSSPRALVIRDGVQQRLAGREVVPGDLVLFAEGDRIPADGVVVAATNLTVNESLLTGESLPVRKIPGAPHLTVQRPGGDGTPFVYSGTLVVQGHGRAVIRATGPRTEMGQIGAELQAISEERTPLQHEVDTVVKIMAVLGLGLCLLVALLYGLARANWLEGLLSGVTLAMSLVPEEIPVVLTVFLAFGAWRIAKRHVLTRRMPSIQTLGAVTVLCTDKTGTLTLNHMAIAVLQTDRQAYDDRDHQDRGLPEEISDLVRVGMLASQPAGADPMDAAFWQFGRDHALLAKNDLEVIREYPLSAERLAFIQVWGRPDGAGVQVAAKGAPEAIASLCQLDQHQRDDVAAQAGHMAGDGLRVLGVAEASWSEAALPDDPARFSFLYRGLVGLADPIRPDVPEAVKQCLAAGVRIVMITGDYPDTARAIARQIGLPNAQDVITGARSNALTAPRCRAMSHMLISMRESLLNRNSGSSRPSRRKGRLWR